MIDSGWVQNQFCLRIVLFYLTNPTAGVGKISVGIQAQNLTIGISLVFIDQYHNWYVERARITM